MTVKRRASREAAVPAGLSGRAGEPPRTDAPTPASGPGLVHGAALIAARDHAVLAAALDPILTIDAHGIIQSASESVRRVFGWSVDELVGRNISVLMPEPHRAAHDGYLTNYRRTGRTNILGHTREFEGVRKNGERFPIDLSVSRVDPPGGGMPLFVGIIRDTTERKRLERELRLVQDLALSISGSPTVTGALIETIRLIAQATGWDCGEAWAVTGDGEHLAPAAAWAHPTSGLEAFAGSMRRFKFRRGEGMPGRAWATGRPEWVADLGSWGDAEFCRPIEASAAGLRAGAAVPILSESTTIAVLVFFVRETRSEDLHLLELVRAAVAPLATLIQRKRAEEELAEYRRNLEDKVEERTSQLRVSEEKLRLADRLASIGTLAAGLGHDMNNVLLPVRAHLNALRAEGAGGGLSAPAAKHVDAISKSAAYLQQLADGLHYLAMDPDKEGGDGETTDLCMWWSQAGLLIAKAVPRHVKVKASFPKDLPEVAIAAAGLTQAVLNLVVNAGEAIPPGRKRVQGSVRVAARATDERWVTLSVTDNGAGMSDDVKRRAFELFFTTKPRGLGTGLGLALVRRVVDGAGGSVEIESAPGSGTTVAITLPVAARPRRGGARVSGPHEGRPPAVVTIRDGRHSGLVRHVLEATGAAAGIGEEPGDAEVWVVEPGPGRAPQAQAWLAGGAGRRLVLFGEPDPGVAAEWSRLPCIVIDQRDDLESVRAAIGRALGRP